MSDAWDLITVSHDEFFAYMNPRDIVLHTEPHFTSWETRNRLEVGRSLPGWRDTGPAVYQLTRRAIDESRKVAPTNSPERNREAPLTLRPPHD